MPVVNFPSLLANVVMSSAVPSPSLTFFVAGLLKMAPCTSVFGIYAGFSSASAAGDTRAQAAAARRAFRAIVNDIGMIELLKIVDSSLMIHRALMGGSRTAIIARLSSRAASHDNFAGTSWYRDPGHSGADGRCPGQRPGRGGVECGWARFVAVRHT